MLLINLFNIENNFLHTIKCHGQLGMEDKDIKIESKELKRTFLFFNYYVSFYTKDNLKDIFTEIDKEVNLGYISAFIPSDIKYWDSICKNVKLLVLCEQTSNSVLNTSYELRVDRRSNGQEYYFFLSKNKLDEILEVIHLCLDNAIIRFILKTDSNQQIPVLSIKYKCENNIEIYSPLILEHDYLKRLIKDDFSCYYECYMEILFHLFVLGVEDLEQENKTVFSKDDTFTLKSDDTYASVFMYAPNCAPKFSFFNEFNIKLVPIQKEFTDTYVGETISLSMDSLVGLECHKLKHATKEKLNIQIDIYSQDRESLKNLFNFSENYTSYANFNFAFPKTLTFDEESIKVSLKIEKLKNNDYNFTLNFFLCKFEINSLICKNFEDLLNNIKLIIYDMTKGGYEEINISPFLKSIKDDNFRLNFNISSLEEANKSIYKILENKRGSFSIQVFSSKNIIVEYKVNSIEIGMIVLSSNRLKEHIETFTKKVPISVNNTLVSSMTDDQSRINIERIRDLKTDINNLNLNQVANDFISSKDRDVENVGKGFLYQQEDISNIINVEMFKNTVLHHEINSSLKETDKFINDSMYKDKSQQSKIHSPSKKTDKQKNPTTPNEKSNNSTNGKFKIIVLIVFVSIIGGLFVYFILF